MASAGVLRLAGAAALVAALLPVGASPAAATWPGLNGSIFAVGSDGGQTRILRFQPNGTPSGEAGSNLTEFSNFSVDAGGGRLVYSKSGDVVMVDLETFEEVPVAAGPGTQTDPTFSFDGRYLVYVSNEDGDQDIYMKDLTDQSFTPINLTSNTTDDWAPAFGNDGTGHGDLIAYVSIDAGGDSEIFTMTPGGTNKTNLTNNDVHDFGPNWHPGFDLLAYSSRDAEDRDQIFTMSWDGTGKDQLTSDDNYNYEPAWSPDGTKIAFTKQGRAVGALGRIYLRSASPGGTETPLTPEGTTGYDRADWQSMPCGQDCEPGEPVKPSVFFSLKRHVVVSGWVIGAGEAAPYGGTCGVGTPIKIQRQISGQFKTIAETLTNAEGTFSKKVPDRTGKYRVVSTAFTDAANGAECLASQAAARTHRHR